MLEIKSSLDWYKVESELRKLGNMLPMFRHDIDHIIKNIALSVKELSQLEVEARNSRRPAVVDRCQTRVKQINEEIKKIEKYHLIAVLGNSL